jgi:hypothetical protein
MKPLLQEISRNPFFWIDPINSISQVNQQTERGKAGETDSAETIA